jgi:type I restriction enzyme S subunit
MSVTWPRGKFGDFLRPNSRSYNLGPNEDANLVGMRWYGEGPFHRELKPAMQIAKKNHFVIRDGDVIYNKLFAWKGSFGIVSSNLDGMFVSDKFPTYELDRTKVDEQWLRWYFRYPPLWDEAQAMSTGSAAVSKLTLNPPKFLLLTMPLPPLGEQRRLVARIEELAATIKQARALRQEAAEEAEALTRAHLNQLFGNPYSGISGEFGIKQWQRIEEVADDVADGPHVTPTYVSEGIPFITVLNITSGRIRFDNYKCITAEDHRQFQQRAKAERGDVLISKDGTLGVPCFVDTDREFSFLSPSRLSSPGVRYWMVSFLRGQFGLHICRSESFCVLVAI